MNLYKFHTFRTDYYFPDFSKDCAFLFGLYHPYNRFPMRLWAIKLYWWLFKHFTIVRHRCIVSNPDKVFPYSEIRQLCPKGSIISFNMGTPGMEQKISMLGMTSENKHFFAKYSVLPMAMSLSRNEIKILSSLKGTGLAPDLLDSIDSGKYVFFRTECVEGENPKNVKMNKSILELVLSINQYMKKNGKLKTSLSHGDFTPWNVIVTSEGLYKMIDWEMAAERELGYDLFTYITHVGALLSPELSLVQLIDNDRKYIDCYFEVFGILDWTPYLKAFAQRRIDYEKGKNEIARAKIYECLL